MPHSWQTLTELTGGHRIVVERVRATETGIALEGPFELPPLARLSFEDQVFVAAFVRSHGSIKDMEKLFGVSYPTIKNRLNRIGDQLSFVAVQAAPKESERTSTSAEVLGRLEAGEISAEQAATELRQLRRS